MKTTKTTELTDKSKDIIAVLSTVDCAQDVYEALNQAPTENLKDMKNMINYILKNRIEIDKSYN